MDISVVAADELIFIPRRVYSNVLNLAVTVGEKKEVFHGDFKILTNDHHIYNVDNNGNNGWYFTFFANNNDFTNKENKASYLSLNSSSLETIKANVHNPNFADTEYNITHKIFYSLPSGDLPEGSTGAATGDVKVNASSEDCAKEITAIALNDEKNKFTSTIDINSECTLTYTITLVPTKTSTSNLAISILRPADNWDIDATSLTSKKPIDPSIECGSDGQYEGCNNNTSIVLKVEGVPYLPVISNRNIYHKVNLLYNIFPSGASSKISSVFTFKKSLLTRFSLHFTKSYLLHFPTLYKRCILAKKILLPFFSIYQCFIIN